MVVMHKGQISGIVPGNARLETFGAICYTGLQPGIKLLPCQYMTDIIHANKCQARNYSLYEVKVWLVLKLDQKKKPSVIIVANTCMCCLESLSQIGSEAICKFKIFPGGLVGYAPRPP